MLQRLDRTRPKQAVNAILKAQQKPPAYDLWPTWGESRSQA